MWTPNEDEKKYLELIMSMCLDALQNKIGNRETVCQNLFMLSETIRELPDEVKTSVKDDPKVSGDL